MTRPTIPRGNDYTGRDIDPGAVRSAVGSANGAGAWEVGDAVVVRDPDGKEWRGVIDVPSVLWPEWWVVRPTRGQRGRTGKGGNHHVHASEMRRGK